MDQLAEDTIVSAERSLERDGDFKNARTKFLAELDAGGKGSIFHSLRLVWRFGLEGAVLKQK